VTNSGELLAEKSVDIKGPDIMQQQQENRGGQRGGGGPGGGGMRLVSFKIQDIVPEGTVVKEGDYIAQLDRTDYDNSLKQLLKVLTHFRQTLKWQFLIQPLPSQT